MAKAFFDSPAKFYTFIEYYDAENQLLTTKTFNFATNCSAWQINSKTAVAPCDYEYAKVGVVYGGINQAIIACMQLYRESIGSYYSYNARGKITEILSSANQQMQVYYNEMGNVGSISLANGGMFKYSYNNKGQLIGASDISGNSVSITYDSYGRVTKTTLNTYNGEQIVNTTAYNDIENKVTTTNEHGFSQTLALDYLNRVTTESLPNGLNTVYNFDVKSNLKKVQAFLNNVEHSNQMSHDDKNNVIQVTSANGTVYELTYDEYGLLTSVTSGNESIITNEYDQIVNNHKKGLLKKQTLGNSGDYYEFEYDTKNQLTAIKINGEKVVEYLYNDTGNVNKVTHTKSGISELYYYTANGELKSSLNSQGDSARYIYDNLKNLQKLSYTVGGKTSSFDYVYDYENNEYTKEGYFNRLTSGFGDETVLYHNSFKGSSGMQALIRDFSHEIDSELDMGVAEFKDKYDFIHYDLNTCHSNLKQTNKQFYDSWHENFANNKIFYAWIKPRGESYAKTNLMLFQHVHQNDEGSIESMNLLYKLFIDSNGYLVLSDTASNIDGTSVDNEICRSNQTINRNTWNLVGIKFNTIEVLNTSVLTTATLILNQELVRGDLCLGNPEITHFVLGLQDNINSNALTSSSKFTSDANPYLQMPFSVCFMGISANNYDANHLNAICTEGQKYLTKVKEKSYNGVIYGNSDAYAGFDVISLNGSLESSKGKSPTKINTYDSTFKNNRSRLFKYDEQTGKHVFGAYSVAPGFSVDGEVLEYDLGLKTQGTMSVWFKLDNNVQAEYRGIFGHKAPTSNANVFYEKLGLFSDNGKLRLKLDGTTSCSALENYETNNCNDNKWHHVVLTYGDSEIYVYYDGCQWIKYNSDVNLNGLKTQVGSFHNSALDRNSKLDGYMQNFAFKNTYIEASEVEKIYNAGISSSVINVSDSLGRREKTVFSSGDNSFEINYTYDKMRIVKETDFKGNTIEYTYDNMGNIATKTIDKNELGSFSDAYTYDSLGRLTGVNFANGSGESYTYDINGNILTYSYSNVNGGGYTRTFTYDSVHKDKLISVSNTRLTEPEVVISYDSNNKFLPVSMIINGSLQNLTWEGKRLIGVGSTTYTYDGTGRRTSKTVNGVTTNFKYVGNNLVKMVTGDSELEFVYDANGVLVGVNTASGNYFYHRDITGNIIGIVDKLGNYMVEYTYNVWGKVSKTVYSTCTDTALATNPFMFKGYFYDEETGFYYLKSRYYYPDICRFISMDDIDYLDETSISGVNLYAYCNNNPVMYADPSGHSPEWWQWALLGVAVVASSVAIVVGTIVSGGLLPSVFVGAGIGFISGVATDIIEQGAENSWDFSKIDPIRALEDGLVEAIIGAITSVFAFGIGQIGSKIGETIGYQLSNFSLNGAKIGQVFEYLGGTSTIMNICSFVGEKTGTFIGASCGFFIANKTFSKNIKTETALTEGYKSMIYSVTSLFL